MKRMMQAASLVGRDFAFRILQAITGMGDELKSHLLVLQGLEFIYEKKLFPELEYIFKHALVQEVAYNSLLRKYRREIHEKTGEAIEALYPGRVEEFYEVLAYHYSQSANVKKAHKYLILSGTKATQNYSHRESFRFYQEAIGVLKQMPSSVSNIKAQIEVRLLIYSPMVSLSFPEGSLGILKEGVRLAKEAGDERSGEVFKFALNNYYSMKGKPHAGIQQAEKSFKEAQLTQNIELIAQRAWQLCALCGTSGDYFKIVELIPNVLALLEKDPVAGFFDWVYPPLCIQYGVSLGMLGDFEKGENYIRKGLFHATKINSIQALGLGEVNYGYFFINKGDGKLAIEHCQNSITYFEEAKYSYLLSIAWSGVGTGYYLLGDLETAKAYIEKGLKIHIDTGAEASLSTHYRYLSMVHCDSGNLKEAKTCAEMAVEISTKDNERHREGGSRIWLGRILGKKDPSQRQHAEVAIREGMEILDELKLMPYLACGYLFLAELYAETGQEEKVQKNLKKAYGMFGEMGMDYWLRKTQEQQNGVSP